MTGVDTAHPSLHALIRAGVATPGQLTAVHIPGLVPYLEMWQQQRTLAAARARGELGDLLLLLEHAPVYTNGRGGDRRHLLVDAETLADLGTSYHEVDRGGDITYHGPGQLVGYPIVALEALGLTVRGYVRALEQLLIRVAARSGVDAHAVPGYTGVWVGTEKLAAIGVRVTRGVAYHGFALNVCPDLAAFDRIVPCGIPDRGVTSLARILGREVAVVDVAGVCADVFAAMLGLSPRWTDQRGNPAPQPHRSGADAGRATARVDGQGLSAVPASAPSA